MYGGHGKQVALAWHLGQTCREESNAHPPTHPPTPPPSPIPIPIPIPAQPTNHHHHSDLLKGIKEGEEGSGEKSHKQTGEAILAGLVLTGLLETLQIEK